MCGACSRQKVLHTQKTRGERKMVELLEFNTAEDFTARRLRRDEMMPEK